jgi:surfeit locus 1 family protein
MAVSDQAVARSGAPAGAPRLVLGALALLLIVLFAGLGTWQVIRLQWKLDLIARVDARVHAAPAAPPPAARWAGITAESDEYRRVQVAGTYLYEYTTPVQALTEQGSGYWLLTPLCTTDGHVILVNRGFIPADPGARTRYEARTSPGYPCAANAGGAAQVVGLLRISEPKGYFLRTNDPGANKWYARDVPAIAAARGLPATLTAPYFIDAAAGQDPAGAPDHPQGGLTVVSFHNSHLVYAVTWYALALMVAGAWWFALRGAGTAGHEHDHEHEHEREH